MKTLLLDRDAWDLVLDIQGNIACGQAPYALAQSVSNALRTFKGDCWFDTEMGVAYLGQTLAEFPPLSVVRADLESCAKGVTGVIAATVRRLDVTDRALTGDILITDQYGNENLVTF